MSTSFESVLRPGARVFVAGHRGLVGRAVVRALETRDDLEILTRTRGELDLRDRAAVRAFLGSASVDLVVMAAGRVGGIDANRRDLAGFLYDNAIMGLELIQAAAELGVGKLVYLGSSCIYPREAPQPINESALLTGPLEPTNEGYALAKIACLKACEYHNRQGGRRFVSLMPTNLYGPYDRFDDGGHVIPSLLRRFYAAARQGRAEVAVWGSGRPLREFLHVDDLASAILAVAESYEAPATLNVGSGEELSIRDLAELVAQTVGFRGQLVFDPSQPDGTPRKALDSGKLRALGWRPEVSLEEGLAAVHRWALDTGAYKEGGARA